jgi:hypothetical protein
MKASELRIGNLVNDYFRDFFLNDFETSCNMDLLFWKGTQIKNINYVHQLQNLYFSLTGEELIFTKDK